MRTLSRRSVISTLATAGAGLAVTEVLDVNRVNAEGTNQLQTQGSQTMALAFRGQHQPKPLPFDPAKLKGLSEKLVRSHWENNYGGAVKALNAVEQRLGAMLTEKDLPPYLYGDVKREELVRTGSVVLHEQYFGCLLYTSDAADERSSVDLG